ncbi:MAG: LEA type 2 family protein [Planctomycetes bacterium]|nr:LEA type 2 family protein [Planctomycetota bacterium]
MNKPAPVAILLLLAGCLASAGCQVQKPQVRINDIKVPAADFHKMDACFQLVIFNPNNFDITLKSLDYRMSVEGTELCRDSYVNVPLPLPACRNAPLSLNVSIVYAKAFETLKNVKPGQIVPYELVGTGKFRVMNVDCIVEVRHVGQMVFLKLPEWKFKKVSIAKGGSPALELIFEVTNPNPLPIPLVSINGSICSGPDVLASIDENLAKELPANQTAELKFDVRVHPGVAARMLLELAREGRRPDFKGELKLVPPESLRQLMLEEMRIK